MLLIVLRNDRLFVWSTKIPPQLSKLSSGCVHSGHLKINTTTLEFSVFPWKLPRYSILWLLKIISNNIVYFPLPIRPHIVTHSVPVRGNKFLDICHVDHFHAWGLQNKRGGGERRAFFSSSSSSFFFFSF